MAKRTDEKLESTVNTVFLRHKNIAEQVLINLLMMSITEPGE
jgi:hypothetical protein